MLAHGLVDRLTKDVDLFTDRDPDEAVAVARARGPSAVQSRGGEGPGPDRAIVG